MIFILAQIKDTYRDHIHNKYFIQTGSDKSVHFLVLFTNEYRQFYQANFDYFERNSQGFMELPKQNLLHNFSNVFKKLLTLLPELPI